MVLPFIKVASLVIKTASKPVAKQIKAHAATNPLFQKAIITAAQGWNKAGKISLL
jgi:hypothetical protein